ncbi:MAG: hypothetical protein Q8P54_01160 [bacterium]|nr:hypothetical protein [bacterium]
MKKILIKLAIAISAVSLLLSAPLALAASKNNQDKPVVLASGEVYEGVYIRAGSTVDIKGKVNGDAILVGSDINVSGEINGNLYAAANNITVSGTVNGSVHLAGNLIDISSKVGKSAYIAGNVIKFSENAKIGTSLMAAGSTIRLDGPVGSQAYLGGAVVNINNTIGGDTVVNASQVNLGSNTSINGNFKYTSDNQAQIANDSKITGTVTKQEVKEKEKADFKSKFIAMLLGIISSFIFGLVIIWALPKSSIDVANYLNNKLLKSILAGFGFLVLVPVVAIVTLFTGVGMHVGLVIGLIYVIVLLTGGIFAALWLGRKITSTKDAKLGQNVWSLAIGLVILAVIGLVPVLGGLVAFVAFLGGVGALTARTFGRIRAVNSLQSK